MVLGDNPFGEASSKYILDVLMAAAKQMDSQLICVTALHERGIMSQFRVIYSLVFRSTISGKLKMVQKDEGRRRMESAYGTIGEEDMPVISQDISGQLRFF